MEDRTLHQLNEHFDSHLADYRSRCADYERREVALMSAQEANTKSIAELADATKGLVEAWNAANALQRLVKWTAGFAGAGAILVWVTDRLG